MPDYTDLPPGAVLLSGGQQQTPQFTDLPAGATIIPPGGTTVGQPNLSAEMFQARFQGVQPDNRQWFEQTYNRSYPTTAGEFDQFYSEQFGQPTPPDWYDGATVPSPQRLREQVDPQGNAVLAEEAGRMRDYQFAQNSEMQLPPVATTNDAPEGRSAYQKVADWLQSAREWLDGPTRMAVQGTTFSLADEAAGLVAGSEAADAERAQVQQFREDAPVFSIAAEMLGGMGLGGTLMNSGLTFFRGARPTATSIIPRSAAEGAAYGAAYGAGSAEGGAQNRLYGAAAGGLAGLGFGGIMGLVGARGAARGTDAFVPSSEALAQARDAAYTAARNAGLVVRADSFQNAVSGIQTMARNAGIDRDLHPAATAALRRLDEAANSGQPLTLQELEILRQVIGDAAGSREAGEVRIASMMRDALDDWMFQLGPNDINAGNPQAAMQALGEGRNLVRTIKKSEIIETAFERATNAVGANYSAAGMQTALRQQFRRIADNERLMRQFTVPEQAAILSVVRGGKVENALRFIGKFAPRGIISFALSGGAGYATGGPIGAGALMLAGEMGRGAATAMSLSNASFVQSLVRSGGSPAALYGNPGAQRSEAITQAFSTMFGRYGGIGFNEVTSQPITIQVD